MTVDIGKVFSDTWAMIKQRWLAMIGLWAAFVGVLILFYIGTIIAAGTWFVTFADAFNGAGGFADATAYGGLGVGFVVITVLIMVGFYTIIFGQFGSMVAMASPTRRPTFRDAFGRGLKGGLTLIGVLILFLLAMIVVWLALILVGLILSFLGQLGQWIMLIGLFVGNIYVSCRFSVLVPVIVVERVFNPIKAINRTWEITGGNVLRILVVMIVFTVLALLMLGVPYALLFAVVDLQGAGMGTAIATLIMVYVIFFAIFFGFMLFSTSMIASLHAQISDTQASEFSKAFE